MRAPRQFLIAAAIIESLQGFALVGFAAYVGVETVIGDAHSVRSAAALTITTVLLGLGALVVSFGLYRCRRWSRGPAVVTQIFALPVSVTFLQGGRFGVGSALAVGGLLALMLLFHPATTRELLA